MLYDDQPISQDEEDKLNRTPFVDEIVELIDRYTEYDEKKDNHDGLVIGLEGAWGSGKTSALNLLENRFRDKNERYVVQRLDSWLAMDCTTLAAEFFKTLGAATIESGISSEYETLLQRIVRNVWGYTLRLVTWIKLKKLPKIGPKIVAHIDKMEPSKWVRKTPAHVLKFGKNVIRSSTISLKVIKIDFGKIIKDTTIRKEKEDLRVDLSKSKKYIIYMIDDIDRLNNDEIAFVMQLVKNIADFPKVIYILAYDRNIVAEALQRIDGKNGRDFMEKIIQVPIQMPEFGKAGLLRYFCDELRTIVQSESSSQNKVRFDTSQGKIIMDKVYMSIEPYLKNFRDCKRLLNAYQIRYYICSRFCAPDDLLCIVVLETFEPGAITYLINHYNAFYSSLLPESRNVSATDIKNYRDEIKQEASCSERALKILASLFPAFATKINETTSAQLINGKALIENRISERENFLSYFILSPNENAVFSDVIKDLLLNWQEEDIAEQLKQWARGGKLQSALLKIGAYCDLYNQDIKLERDRWMPILHGISSVQNIRLYANQTYTWADVPWAVVEKIIDLPIFGGNPDHVNIDTAGWIVDIFRDENVSLETLEVLMWHIGSGYEWARPESYADSAPEVEEDLFMSCKELFVRRLKGNLSKEGFFDSVMINLFLAHLMKEDMAYLNQYLASLSTIESIYPWLKVALEEETHRKFYGLKRRAWHHKDDLLAITPKSYAALVDKELDQIPEDWLSDQKWTTLVLYDAYVHQETWTQTKGAFIKEESLEEYGNKVYHARKNKKVN